MSKYSKIPKFNLGKYSKIPKFVNMASSKKETSLMKVHSFGSFPPQILVGLRGGTPFLGKNFFDYFLFISEYIRICAAANINLIVE